MKSLKLLAALFLVIPALAQSAEPRDPNPTKDPDVQRGYDEHQEQQRQKDTKEEFTVHKSGEGYGGNPTSGGFVPSDVKDDSKK